MAVKEYFRNRVMWKKPRMLSNDAPKENWLELFYDLELVAAAFALDENLLHRFINEDPYETFFLAFVMFAILWTSWLHFQLYLNRFFEADLVHKLLYFAQMLGVFIMSLYIGYGTIFKFRFSFIAFVTGFIITRVSLMIMYGLVLLFYQGQGRLHIWAMNLGYALSVAVFFGSVWICNDQLLQFSVWGIGLLVEQLPMLIFEAVAQQQVLPLRICALLHRNGAFIMFMIGEPISQLVTFERKEGETEHVRDHLHLGLLVVLTFFQLFLLALIHFDLQPEIDDESTLAIYHQPISRAFHIFLHLPLTFGFLLLGASINLFTYEHYKTADIDVWVTSLSILIVMVSFTLVRFSIKGIANSSRKRRLRYAYRFCLSFLCILVSPSQSS